MHAGYDIAIAYLYLLQWICNITRSGAELRVVLALLCLDRVQLQAFQEARLEKAKRLVSSSADLTISFISFA